MARGINANVEKDRFDLDVWVRMYEEQVRHARHHESLRSTSTNIAVVVTAAALGLFAADVTSDQRWVLPLFVILINVYGLLMSRKHHERSRMHHAVSSSYREVISEFSKVGENTMNERRRQARNEHEASHPLFGRVVQANQLWSGLHVLLAALGAFLLFA